MAYVTFTNVFLRPKSVRMSIFKYLRRVKPKTLSLDSPRQRNLNRGSCHTLILDLKILLQISLLFSNTFKFTVFSTVLQLRTLLLQSFNFYIKSYKRVFWSFPTKEPILVLAICPWAFSICLHESYIKFCTKPS